MTFHQGSVFVFSAPFPGSHSRNHEARSKLAIPRVQKKSRATKEPMLSIFLRHVKHLGAVLMDTLELCMQRSGAVLGCALLSSHHPPFSVLVSYLLPPFPVKGFFLGGIFFCLFGQALGLSLRNSARRADTTDDCGAAHDNSVSVQKYHITRHLQHKSCKGSSL